MNIIEDQVLREFLSQNSLKFNNMDLLRQAFIHRSYLNEHRGCPFDHNERLEFLGDAVLELVVTEYLYINYPNPEGELTNWRSALVKGESLAKVAKTVGVPDLLLLSHGEEKSGGRQKGYLLANAYEALLGAIYLDQGYEACRQYISSTVIGTLADILENRLYIDPKSRLQELTQAEFGVTPMYEIVSEEGPDHSKIFEVAVFIGEKQIGVGKGNSKQSAQVIAAENALKDIDSKES